MTFPNQKTLFLGFSTSEYGIVSLSTATPTLSELFVPTSAPIPTSSHSGGLVLPGIGGLGGLALKTGGYMGIGGIGRVAKNSVVKVNKDEVFIVRESRFFETCSLVVSMLYTSLTAALVSFRHRFVP
jgi:hypothetical protein